MQYTPQAWYWIVDGDDSHVWSSAAAAYVAATDDTYTAWREAGGQATRIASEAELRDVLQAQYPAGWPVPAAVSMRQARLALLAAGLLDQVAAAIGALASDDAAKAKIEWDYATDVRRDHWLIATLAAALGLSDAQVDKLFSQAAAL